MLTLAHPLGGTSQDINLASLSFYELTSPFCTLKTCSLSLQQLTIVSIFPSSNKLWCLNTLWFLQIKSTIDKLLFKFSWPISIHTFKCPAIFSKTNSFKGNDLIIWCHLCIQQSLPNGLTSWPISHHMNSSLCLVALIQHRVCCESPSHCLKVLPLIYYATPYTTLQCIVEHTWSSKWSLKFFPHPSELHNKAFGMLIL